MKNSNNKKKDSENKNAPKFQENEIVIFHDIQTNQPEKYFVVSSKWNKLISEYEYHIKPNSGVGDAYLTVSESELKPEKIEQ